MSLQALRWRGQLRKLPFPWSSSRPSVPLWELLCFVASPLARAWVCAIRVVQSNVANFSCPRVWLERLLFVAAAALVGGATTWPHLFCILKGEHDKARVHGKIWHPASLALQPLTSIDRLWASPSPLDFYRQAPGAGRPCPLSLSLVGRPPAPHFYCPDPQLV